MFLFFKLCLFKILRNCPYVCEFFFSVPFLPLFFLVHFTSHLPSALAVAADAFAYLLNLLLASLGRGAGSTCSP